MEQFITIPTSNKFEIQGILNWDKKSSKLIIFCHGLTWSTKEAHYYAAKNYFVEKWYNVFRFYFYTSGEKTRNLWETTIVDHGHDIDSVLDFFQNTYDEIYIITHSLWWPSFLLSKKRPKNLIKVVHWDPAFDTVSTAKKVNQVGDIYFYGWIHGGKNSRISQKMYKELLENPWLQKIKNNPENQYIIFAWECNKIDFKPQTDALGIPSAIIAWADHGFTQEGKYEELFETTLKFIS